MINTTCGLTSGATSTGAPSELRDPLLLGVSHRISLGVSLVLPLGIPLAILLAYEW